MPVEPPVLFQQKSIYEDRRRFRERRPEAILLVGGERDAKQFAIRRPDRRGERHPLRERRVRPEAQDGEDEGYRGEGSLHGFTISMVPAALMPTTVRSYMPSAKAGGAW